MLQARSTRLSLGSARQIDWEKPITKGLISDADAQGVDWVTGAGVLYNSTAVTRAPNALGVGVNFGQNQIDFPATPFKSNTNQTHMMIAAPSSGSFLVAGINNGMAFRRWNGNLVSVSQNFLVFWDFTAWTKMQVLIHVIGSSENTTQAVYIDGAVAPYVNNNSGSFLTSSICTLGGSTIGDRSSGTWWNQPVMSSRRWDRALSLKEIADISANPAMIYR